MASQLTDKELIAEFTKRFIVARYYTRKQIEAEILANGKDPTEAEIDNLIALFREEGYYDTDESLRSFIENTINDPE